MVKENEPIHYRVDPARTAYIKFYIFGLIILAASIYSYSYFGDFIILIGGCMILVLIILGVEIVRRFGLTLYIKEDGITREEGVFSKEYVEIDYEQIVRTVVREKFIDRILRKGTLEIDTTGMAKAELEFKNIPNPMKYKRIVDALIEKKRHEMHRIAASPVQPTQPTTPQTPKNRGESY